MKKKDLVSLRKKDVKELKKMAEDKKNEALNAHVKMLAGQEKNLKKARNLRREVAQILTIVKEKEFVEELTKETEEKAKEEKKEEKKKGKAK